VSGSGVVGYTVKVYDGATLLGSTVVTASGTWSYVASLSAGLAHADRNSDVDGDQRRHLHERRERHDDRRRLRDSVPAEAHSHADRCPGQARLVPGTGRGLRGHVAGGWTRLAGQQGPAVGAPPGPGSCTIVPLTFVSRQ